jgi:hypothetical protein
MRSKVSIGTAQRAERVPLLCAEGRSGTVFNAALSSPVLQSSFTLCPYGSSCACFTAGATFLLESDIPSGRQPPGGFSFEKFEPAGRNPKKNPALPLFTLRLKAG